MEAYLLEVIFAAIESAYLTGGNFLQNSYDFVLLHLYQKL